MNLDPTLALPQEYSLVKRLDIREKKSLILINMLGVVLLIASWFLFTKLVYWIRPELGNKTLFFSMQGILDTLVFLGILLLVTAVMLFFHEGLHGVCFWAFTKTHPRFAFKGFYAYAAAPDWYLPKGKYLVTALTPLAGITLTCLALIAFVNLSWLPALLWMLVLNTSGSVGDIWVAITLMRTPAEVYVRDSGDIVEFYAQVKQSKMTL